MWVIVVSYFGGESIVIGKSNTLDDAFDLRTRFLAKYDDAWDVLYYKENN